MKFTFEVGEHGWATARIESGGQILTMQVSYLTAPDGRDAPETILHATTQLLRENSLRKVFSFPEEPGEFVWALKRLGPNVDIHIGHNQRICLGWPDWEDEDGGHTPDAIPANRKPSNTRIVFHDTCPLIHFAEEVERAFAAELKRLGTAGYERDWHKPFPQEAFRQLREALAAAKRHRT
jgi:hypothetical protein